MAGNVLQFAVNMSMLMNGNISSQSAKTAQALSSLGQKMQSFQKTGKLIQSFQSQQSKVEGLRQKMVAAREKVRLMREEMRKTDQPTAAMQKRFAQAQKEAGLLGEQFQTQRKKLADLNSELLKSGVNTGKLISEQNKLAANTDKVKAAQERLTRAQEKYSSLRSQVFDWNNVKSTVIQAAAAFSAFKAPVKLAADFESAMAKVQAVGFTDGKNMEGFALMREQALRLGAETKFTAVEAARAQEQLIRGGMTPQQAMQAMTGTLNMAAAEGMTIDEAAYIIAKGLGGLNIEATLAPRYADILAYTSSKSNTNIHNIGEAMRIAAPVAAPQGIQMEKLASYIGVLANKGFESTQAGNAIASALGRLAKRPKAADKSLDMLGIQVKTKSGRFVELPDIMQQLSESFARRALGEVDQLAHMQNIFGAEYGKEMMAFMAAVKSGEQERMQTGTYIESFGWAGKMSDINIKTLNGQLDILKSAWDGLRITIGDMFTPIVKDGVGLLADGLSRINKFMKDFPVASKAFMEFLAVLAAGKAAIGIFNILRAAVQLPVAFAQLKLAEHAAAMAALGTGATTTAASMGTAAASAGVFGSNLLAALGWIGAIVAASIAIYENWDKIKALWADLTAPKIEMPNVQTPGGKVIPQWQTQGGIVLTPSPSRNADMSTLGQKMDRASRAVGGRNKAGWTPHAMGGIMTRPHLGLVAEAGPEAIIPLRNKSRALPLLTQTMNLLGVPPVPTIQPLNTAGITNEYSYDTRSNPSDNRSWNRNSYSSQQPFQPTVNITVNMTGGSADMDITNRIRQAVIEAMSEIAGYNERVAYA